ncbi:glycosyltransferase family 2 protein [Sphingomonas lacusdianchii]|uniref:glycosyltransferase family 2 protein n=1 Tax=Sphingomonas lacusdianchii TaxID=2917992 RepID=UPI001F57B270
MALTPLLSIVIPTKNRQEQCIQTIRSVLSFQDDFELVVFDSSDDGDLLAREFAALGDQRIKHHHVPALKNMTQCFEEAVKYAHGDFICMIGDDDGVTPQLFSWTRRAQREGLTSVTSDPRVYAAYNWPGIRSKYFGEAVSGKLFLRLDPTVSDTVVDARSQIDAFLDNAGQGCSSMPRVYHGIVARSTLTELHAEIGHCFDGVSPDVSFSYFAAYFSPRHAIIDLPLTIGGASVSSNAGRSAMRQHKGDLWSDPHMRSYIGEPWPADVPEFFSVETVWGQATLAAIDRAGRDRRDRFNFSRFYALLLVRHPDRQSEIMKALGHHGRVARAKAIGKVAPVVWEHGVYAAKKVLQRAWPDRKIKTLSADSIEIASDLVAQALAQQHR